MIKVLVTNDDGIDARGLEALVEALGGIADVYAVAPMEQHSGMSMSITFMREVRAEKRDLKGAVEAYAIDGTPADCIKWGLGTLAEEGITPDYVISGINLGYNLGSATHYSGTFSAAKEGALWGVRSIALSVGSHEATHFDYILGLLPRLMDMSQKLSPSVILNVNAPDIPSWDVKGVKVVPAAPYEYSEKYVFKRTGNGQHQMVPDGRPKDPRVRFDFDWTAKGYVTVSPVPAEQSDPAAIMKLNGQTLQTDCLTVIIDAQEQSLARVRKAKRFKKHITKLAHAVSRMGMPLLVTESFDMGAPLPGLAQYTGEAEKVVHIHPDAWTSPDMEKYVEAIDMDRVLIAGAATNVAVLQTALGFAERGFRVTVAEDCCAAADKRGHKDAIEDLRAAGCRVSTLETEVMRMAGSCERQVLTAVRTILEEE